MGKGYSGKGASLHRSLCHCAAGALAALAALGPPTAAAQVPGLPAPDLPVPVPTVTLPPAPDLPVPVPTVTLPPGRNLPVPVPTATPLPAPQLPSARLPDAPALPVAPVRERAEALAPNVGGAPASAGGSGQGAGPAQSRGANSAPSQTAGSAPRAAGGAASAGPAAAAPASSARSAPARRAASSRTATRARPNGRPPTPRERREHRLRRTVERLNGCLDTIGGMPRRVLVLRAGLGASRAHSRRAVAERLHTTIRGVARAERSGLRELRSAASAGRCGDSAPAFASAAPGGPAAAASLTTVASTTDAAEPEARAEPRPGVSGVQEEFRTSRPPDAPATILPPVADATEPPLVILLTAAFLVGFAAVWARERRRLSPSRRGPPAPGRS
jgi:hypothetical protein